MATAISSRPTHNAHDMDSAMGFAASSSSLERSRSASSSSTAHPHDSTESKEEKASSSNSSSPTYQSNSSSSIHKTISTAVSSTTTTGSLSPPSSHTTQKRQSKIAPLTQSNENESTEKKQNGYSWDPEDLHQKSRRERQAESPSEQELMPSRRQRDNEWSYEQFDEGDRSYSPFADEAMPMHYPPISEEEKEARAIQMNLERWASQERQRRKALRTSRTGSMLVTPTAPPGKLTKRLSALNILGPKNTISPTYARGSRISIVRNNSDKYDAAAANSPTTPQDPFPPGSQSNGDYAWDRDQTNTAKGMEKGKGKESSNPFSDPQTQTRESTSPTRRRSIKPTSKAPIVTPGKAPTTRHRALINALNSGGSGRMPSIVATDADEEKEAVRQIQELTIDPFQSASEVDQHKQYVMARDAARRTLLEGDEGAHIISPPPPIMAPHRKSTSSSKFNEIGLNDEDNSADTSDWNPRQDYNRDSQVASASESRPWWVQLFCGCTDIKHHDDEEQSGRTFPE